MLRDLLSSTALRAPADEPAGAGGAGGAAAAAGSDAPGAAAEAAAAPGAGAAAEAAAAGAGDAAPKPTSLLDATEAAPGADSTEKPGDERPGDDDGEKKEGEDDQPKPPDYSALKVPDGLDPASPMIATLKETAAKSGLAPEAVQTLVDAVGPQVKEALDAPYKAWGETNADWIQKVQADPEIGGAKFKESMAICRKGVERFAGTDTPKVLEVLAFTGAGNNPDFVRFMFRVGKAVSEGLPTIGRGAVPGPKNPGDAVYPSMAKES